MFSTHPNSVPPLVEAVETRNTERVKRLLKEGAKPNSAKKFSDTALTLAAKEGHFEIVKLLVAANAGLDVASPHGDTPLTCAAKEGHLEVVEFLRDAGADVNLAGRNGLTALFCALEKGHFKVVGLLLDAPKLNLTIQEGLKAVEAARGYGEKEVGKSIVRLIKAAMVQRFLKAACEGNSYFVKEYIAANKNKPKALNVTNKYGNTALHFAAMNGKSETVKILLECFDLNTTAQNEKGKTAAQVAEPDIAAMITAASVPRFLAAACAGREETVRQYIAVNKDNLFAFDVVDKDGNTALHLAARYGWGNIVNDLLALPDLDLIKQNKRGKTAAQIAESDDIAKMITNASVQRFLKAAWAGNLYFVKKYIAVNKDNPDAFDVADEDGNTALHLAACYGCGDIVKELLALPNLDITKQNKRGKTAAEEAWDRNYRDIANLISAEIIRRVSEDEAVVRESEPVATARAGQGLFDHRKLEPVASENAEEEEFFAANPGSFEDEKKKLNKELNLAQEEICSSLKRKNI